MPDGACRSAQIVGLISVAPSGTNRCRMAANTPYPAYKMELGLLA
ncbi:hypothetical protein SF123566_5297 [Shigella flexneri 1235-66]|nr:hypothetical protein SF123566_5297 [Shigella flexneri 1235-66]